MTSIGDALRSERLQRGWKLEQIAAETKIPVHYLEAMEADHFSRLPGGVITRSFLLQYVRILGLGEEEVMGLFKEQFEIPVDPLPPPLPKRRHISFQRLPAVVWLLAAMFACTAAYRLWQSERASALRVQRPKTSEPASNPSPPGHEEQASRLPATVPAVTGAAERAETSVDAGSSADKGPPLRVGLTTFEPVWVSIDVDGSRAYSGTLGGQQSKEFAASTRMTVLVGNAGGVAISLNGRPVGPIGGRGEVRSLELTSQGARIVSRTSTPPRLTEPEPDDAAPH